MIRTINDQVACKPFETHSNQIEIKSGVAKAKTKEILIKLEVVLDYKNDDIQLLKGDIIGISAQCSMLPYARVEYKLEDSKFVLIPVKDIILIEQGGVSNW